MTAAAYLEARGWRPWTYEKGWWYVIVPVGRRHGSQLAMPPGEIERLATDLGWTYVGREP
jgi:hypothetical protein